MRIRHLTGLLTATLAFTALESCAMLNDAIRSSAPDASIVGARLAGLDLQGVDLVFDVEVTNHYGVELPLLGIDFNLAHAGASFLEGAMKDAGSIPAKGSRTLPVATRVDFAQALRLLSDLHPGAVVDYLAKIGVSVDAPGVGELRLPLEKSGEFPVPTVPDVSVANIKWEKLGLSEATALLSLDIANTNDFPVDLSRLAYDLKLGGSRVAESAVDRALSFAKGERHSLDLRFSLKPSDLGMAAFRMLSGQGAGYEIGGNLDLGTRFGDLKLPFRRSGQTPFSK